jgi:hypothetical protein
MTRNLYEDMTISAAEGVSLIPKTDNVYIIE